MFVGGTAAGDGLKTNPPLDQYDFTLVAGIFTPFLSDYCLG
jgi:hypothetical protein